jgi:hypothetical protein
MFESLQFHTPPGTAMKALVIYNDFGSAARANAALQRSAHCANSDARCITSPWRIEMLKFPPTAEEALKDALDAHLVVIVGDCTQSPPAWFQCWLEHWAKSRHIKRAALALFSSRCAGHLADPAIREFSSIADRHGLSLICDGSPNRENRWNVIQLSSAERGSWPSGYLHPLATAPIQHPHPRWGINE